MKTCLAALLLLFPCTGAAQNNEISLFLGGTAVETNTIAAFAPEDFEIDLAFENGRSSALAFNHFWRDSFSTELAILGIAIDPTVKLRSGPLEASVDIGDASLGALTGVAQWHFRRLERLAPYIGGGIALIRGEIESELPDELGEVATQSAELEGAAAILFNAGVNIRLAHRWAFAIDVKVIPYSADIDDDAIEVEEIVITELDLNPVIVGFGVRYRF